eukprot:scaffold112498_cov20-Tisochrysis_lutea.AAC.4
MVVCSRRKLTYPALAIAAHLPPPVLLMSSVLQQVMPYNALAIAAHLPPVLLMSFVLAAVLQQVVAMTQKH